MTLFYGVWADGLCVTYFNYGQQSDVFLGTHVGNSLHIVLGTYEAYYTFTNATYDLAYCSSFTETYISTYGVTYAATYYQDTACNVRKLEWV